MNWTFWIIFGVLVYFMIGLFYRITVLWRDERINDTLFYLVVAVCFWPFCVAFRVYNWLNPLDLKKDFFDE